MTSTADGPPRPKEWEENFFERWPRLGQAVIEGTVHRRERLGGLLNYYYRKAA
jgi:hypothetical protein